MKNQEEEYSYLISPSVLPCTLHIYTLFNFKLTYFGLARVHLYR